MQLLGALVVASVAVLAVVTSEGLLLPLMPPWMRTWGGGSGGLSASLAGLALAYALPIVGILDGLMIYSAETEQAREVYIEGR